MCLVSLWSSDPGVKKFSLAVRARRKQEIMKRLLIGLFVVTLALVWGVSGLNPLQAASPAQQVTPTPQNWTPGTLVRVKASVPFVWLRVTPSVVSAVMATVQSNDYLVIAGASPSWDGTHWWGLTRWGPLRG